MKGWPPALGSPPCAVTVMVVPPVDGPLEGLICVAHSLPVPVGKCSVVSATAPVTSNSLPFSRALHWSTFQLILSRFGAEFMSLKPHLTHPTHSTNGASGAAEK